MCFLANLENNKKLGFFGCVFFSLKVQIGTLRKTGVGVFRNEGVP